jgi:tetraacyldisaccharide 4'-kinase
MLSTVYAAVARRRRRYYATHPHLQRALSRPVISIGNLAVGGRAKTPLAALVATRLRDLGERPAILSRGYARRDAADGVVVV